MHLALKHELPSLPFFTEAIQCLLQATRHPLKACRTGLIDLLPEDVQTAIKGESLVQLRSWQAPACPKTSSAVHGTCCLPWVSAPELSRHHAHSQTPVSHGLTRPTSTNLGSMTVLTCLDNHRWFSCACFLPELQTVRACPAECMLPQWPTDPGAKTGRPASVMSHASPPHACHLQSASWPQQARMCRPGLRQLVCFCCTSCTPGAVTRMRCRS